LSPVQVVVATITEQADTYAASVHEHLLKAGLRAELDISSNKINYKVREHSLRKVPVMLIVGAKEKEQNSVSIRRLGSEQQQSMPLTEVCATLAEEAKMPE